MSVDAADTERLLDDYAIDLSDLSEDASEHSCSAECSVKAADGGCCCGSVPVVEKPRNWTKKDSAVLVGECGGVTLATYGVYAIFFNAYCGFLFRCGCKFAWDGGGGDCNIMNGKGPMCPWCTVRSSFTSIWFNAFITALTTLLIGRKYGHSKKMVWVWPFTLAISFLVYCFFIALFYKIKTGYPYFITGPMHPAHEAQS